MRVPPAPLDDEYDVRGANAGKMERKVRVPLFLRFIGWQKAYESVDRTLLWRGLTRFGVPPQILEIIRQFHDGMRACGWDDDGVYSE